jgi:hypothetical protein
MHCLEPGMTEELAAEEFEEELEDGESETDEIDEEEGGETDNIGDPSVEINVESLIRELESDGFVSQLDKEKNARKRLEELMERKRAKRELEDFDDYDI